MIAQSFEISEIIGRQGDNPQAQRIEMQN